MKKQVQGMTLIGMLLTMAVVIFAGLVTIRVVPVYINYFSIIQSIKSLNAMPASEITGDPEQDVATLRKAINKRLEINGIEYLKEDQLMISPEGERTYEITLKYQVVRPLLYNVSLMFNFEDKREVTVGSDK